MFIIKALFVESISADILAAVYETSFAVLKAATASVFVSSYCTINWFVLTTH
jgi:hypothetical protein